MTLIINGITCILEVFIFYNFMSAFADARKPGKVYGVFCCTGLGLSIFFINLFNHPTINLIGVFGLMIVAGKFMFLMPGRKAIYYSLIVYVTLFLGEFLIVIFIQIGYHYNFLKDDSNYYISLFVGISAKLLSLLLTKYLELLLVIDKKKIKKSQMACFYIMPVISVILCASIFQLILENPMLNGKILSVVICCGSLLVANFMIFMLSFRIQNIYEYAAEMEIFKLTTEMKEKQYELLEEKDREYSAILHDINHYLNIINYWNESGKESKELASRLKKEINNVQKKMWCDRHACNAVLNDKCKLAEKIGVSFEGFVEPGFTADQLSDFDLIGILSNLIDNALDAASQAPVEEKWVKVKLFRVGESSQSILRIENSYDFSNRANINFEKSTKANSMRHGYGLKNVREIVKRNDGVLTIEKAIDKVIILVGIPG